MNKKHENKSFQIIVSSIIGSLLAFIYLNEAYLPGIRVYLALFSGILFGPLFDFLAQKLTQLTLKWIGEDDAE